MRYAIPFLLTACAGTPDPATANPEPLEALSQHVADTYALFADRTDRLERATASFCVALSPETLAESQAAWWEAREPWKRSEIVNFGPVVEYPERLGPQIDDQPINERAIEDLVEETEPLDFGAMGSATRGFPVLEYLLWSDGSLEALAESPRRCQLLSGGAADLHGNAARLLDVWQRDWQAQVAGQDASEGVLWASPQEVVDEWVNRMAFTVENIRVTKLGKPAGDKAGGEPQPDTLESRLSARSLMDARDALQGVSDVWSGREGQPGLSGLVGDAELIARLSASLETASQRLAAVPETLEQTIQSQPEQVAQAQAPLQELQVLIQVELAQELNVTITFNDNDGD